MSAQRNKIEQAIYDCKLRLDHAKHQRMLLATKIETLEEELSTLEVIRDNAKIPHGTDAAPISTSTTR